MNQSKELMMKQSLHIHASEVLPPAFNYDIQQHISVDEQNEVVNLFQQSLEVPLPDAVMARISILMGGNDNFFIRIYQEGQLVACSILTMCTERNLYAPLCIPNTKVAAFSMAVVAPPYQGNGLYKALNAFRLLIARELRAEQLFLHTQNRKVMRGMMAALPQVYPRSKRLPLEVVPKLYGAKTADESTSIKKHDIDEWGYSLHNFNPELGDALRLRWRLI